MVVSITSDSDFSQERSEHNLVEPVDEGNMEGITISAQRLTETFSGKNEANGVREAFILRGPLESQFKQQTVMTTEERAIEMMKKGYGIEDIAKILGKEKTEIDLLIKFHS